MQPPPPQKKKKINLLSSFPYKIQHPPIIFKNPLSKSIKLHIKKKQIDKTQQKKVHKLSII